MNKVLLTIVMILPMFLLCGCVKNDSQRIAEDYTTVILQCLNGEREISQLEALFCDAVSESHDIESEIEYAMKTFIDGNFVNEGEWRGMFESGSSVRDGKLVRSDIFPQIDDLETNSGKKYDIVFRAYTVYEEKPDYVGIMYIEIFDITDTDYREGVRSYVIGGLDC